MTRTISVLGDSLSVPGYGLSGKDVWPKQLMSFLQGYNVTVHAKGGLLASATPDHLPLNYFGRSQYLGRAINTESSIYLILLGANDVLNSFSKEAIVYGLSRLVRQLKVCSTATFKRNPEIVLVQTPNFIRESGECSALERRRLNVLVPALKKVAATCGCVMSGSILLKAADKHTDGTHLNKKGALIVAKEVKRTLDLNQTIKSKLKQPHRRNSLVSPHTLRRGQAAAREYGKSAFMKLSRAEVRKFASTYNIPFRGGSKEEEKERIIAKLGLRWARIR